jgi:hypothetical protein
MLLVTLALAEPCYARSKVPVFIAADTGPETDAGERDYFSDLQEEIRGSDAYRLVEDSARYPYLKVYLTSLNTTGRGITISYVVVYESLATRAALTSGFQTCSSVELNSCAHTVVGQVDDAFRMLQQDNPTLAKTLE